MICWHENTPHSLKVTTWRIIKSFTLAPSGGEINKDTPSPTKKFNSYSFLLFILDINRSLHNVLLMSVMEYTVKYHNLLVAWGPTVPQGSVFERCIIQITLYNINKRCTHYDVESILKGNISLKRKFILHISLLIYMFLWLLLLRTNLPNT